jgi:NADH-quinone oxidoreductase subunit G
MSANQQSTDTVNVEVDGIPIKARKGAMIIHVTDAMRDAYVPRFCYHDKLPIAANCRMCLVEVEKAPKPLPACATPVAEGMRIFTKSPNAIAAQKATMEFLLINHPLDCPICDQGGECELQDLALGFGRDISRFSERKRVVKDKDIGPLVSTDMTRCIHCTRCVRFGQEIAGIQELGTTGRGENMEIGTYVERTVDHELAGNIIDLCPVGALNNKPFRYRGRSWEMTQHALVSPHDAVGTNLYGHVLRGRLMRVVPRPNEHINETWIADRDRFGGEGLYSADRVQAPLIREQGQLVAVGWERALEYVAQGLRSRAPSLGLLASPASSLEELYLAARLMRALGSSNIDHRLRTQDFRDAPGDPAAPALGVALRDVDALDALLLVGANLRAEAPILAHRVRKAAKRGARVAVVTPGSAPELLFPVAAQLAGSGRPLLDDLLGVLAAAGDADSLPAAFAALAGRVRVDEAHRAVAAALKSGQRRAVWLGGSALRHGSFADLRAVAAALARATGATLGFVPEGGNGVGAWLAGCVPHRGPGGVPLDAPGLDAASMCSSLQRAYVLWGGVEPGEDLLSPTALSALSSSEFVVAATPFASDELRGLASAILPIGTYAETSGTWINLEGRWQSCAGAARPVGEARPGWKVARVLGNLVNAPGFDYDSPEQVREELRRLASAELRGGYHGAHVPDPSALGASGQSFLDVPIYRVDALVRRSAPLQATRLGGRGVRRT